ncbi:lipoprotein [Streptomyces sp. NRRL B-1140]|uniref:hypothetical protein n=1 Tax=Streptomyces sp. NRRL B-1140 TaxID=1415549 RepID=UPI0006AFD1A5|nr:hypothetical protein [Streptomyces sp. NRRL B-1140]KOV96455.1 lipoprotein [Streptomyces sp. NRRL B-1140]
MIERRYRPIAFRTLALGACVAGLVALTGCSPASRSSGGTGTSAVTSSPVKGEKNTDGTASPQALPADKVSPSADGKASPLPVPAGTPAAPASGPGASAGAGGADDGCDHKMPISPDEIAVYRYTPEGGSLSLIFRHGNWGCGSPDSDGAPFETVGKETYLPMDQAAYVTVTDPIVASTENQPIGVQEFLDWLEAHPDSGLVFHYHLGTDGAIDRLEQVFTP